jgi:hypothetical protein
MRQFLLSLSVFFYSFGLFAQQAANQKPTLDAEKVIFSLEPFAGTPVPSAGFHQPDPTAVSLDVALKHLRGIEHPSPSELDALKAAKTIQKKPLEGAVPQEDGNPEVVVTPIVNRNFQANLDNGWFPPDNTMAISDDGYIVSCVNSSISYYTENGSVLLQSQSLGQFFDFLPNISDFIYDPKVIYDAGEDKFIMVSLHSNIPSESRILISFSVSSNPQDGWWTYVFNGDVLSNGRWFDFPSIGVSNEDLFISGNLFTASNDFDQVVVLQIDKDPGFLGNTVNWEFFSGVTNGLEEPAFTVVPASYGYDGGYGPGIYLVSTYSGWGNYSHLYDITGDVDDNQVINAFEISTTYYEAAGNALQLGSSKNLDVGDCRVTSAYYADGVVHYVHMVDYENGYAGIRYNRLNVSGQSVAHSNFGLNQYDYCYPSIAPFGTASNPGSVMIGFLRTSATIYPEFRVVGVDGNFDWSGSVQVRSGQAPITVSANQVERWGDYSGISRRHNASGSDPAVWISGCYGIQNGYGNWIAEVLQDGNIAPPQAAFSATPLSGQAPLTVNFADLSANASNWTWSFEGGNPATSTISNPTVTFANPGTYNVELVVSNLAGNDTEFKANYITVENPSSTQAVIETPSSTVFPNPVRDQFSLELELPESTVMTIDLLDAGGAKARTLFHGRVKAGTNVLQFNRQALPSGIYFLSIRTEKAQLSYEKIVVD